MPMRYVVQVVAEAAVDGEGEKLPAVEAGLPPAGRSTITVRPSAGPRAASVPAMLLSWTVIAGMALLPVLYFWPSFGVALSRHHAAICAWVANQQLPRALAWRITCSITPTRLRWPLTCGCMVRM